MTATLLDAHFPFTAEAIGRLQRPYGDGPAYSLARDRYADELLPALLGGEWKHTSSGPPLCIRVTSALLDHAEVFCRRGARGPLTLENAAVIAAPYGQGPERRLPHGADDDAAELAILGLGVWTRSDLSAWYPGWTQLVLAARGLLREDAQRWGFRVLA